MTALGYRFRLDKHDLTARQTALDLSVNLDPLYFEARYARAVGIAAPDPAARVEGKEREQMDLSLRGRLDEHWSAIGRYRRDLDAGRSLLGGMGLKYEDECFLFETALEREFRVAGGDADTRVSVRIVFRDLGSNPATQGVLPGGRAQTTPSARSPATSASE